MVKQLLFSNKNESLNRMLTKLVSHKDKEDLYIVISGLKIYGKDIASVEDGRKKYFDFFNVPHTSARI